jgi:hypothetical protein
MYLRQCIYQYLSKVTVILVRDDWLYVPIMACDCSIIERVEKYKYLGVTIDRKLCWASHIEGVKNQQKLGTFMHGCIKFQDPQISPEHKFKISKFPQDKE